MGNNPSSLVNIGEEERSNNNRINDSSDESEGEEIGISLEEPIEIDSEPINQENNIKTDPSLKKKFEDVIKYIENENGDSEIIELERKVREQREIFEKHLERNAFLREKVGERAKFEQNIKHIKRKIENSIKDIEELYPVVDKIVSYNKELGALKLKKIQFWCQEENKIKIEFVINNCEKVSEKVRSILKEVQSSSIVTLTEYISSMVNREKFREYTQKLERLQKIEKVNKKRMKLVEKLKKQKEEENDISKCIKCRKNERDVTILPCGHFIFCVDCVKKEKKCTLCNVKIEDFTKVFDV